MHEVKYGVPESRRIRPSDYSSAPGSLKPSQRDQASLERARATSPALCRDINDNTEDVEHRIALAKVQAALQ